MRFTPINKFNIKEFRRGKEDGSTEFSFSRFLTPYLAGYSGQAIYLDCDMLVCCDIAELLEHCDLNHDVFVCKHDYTPKSTIKFLGNEQVAYPRKNWSSLIVFNSYKPSCRRLTPEMVNNAPGSFLHRFEWCEDKKIGELPKKYNFLVGEYEPIQSPKIIHYTNGTPCFKGFENQDYADWWFKEKELMNAHH